MKPMLVVDAPLTRMVPLAEDPAWAFQVKYNGHRVLISIQAGVATVIGRDGQHSQHNGTLRRHGQLQECAALPNCVIDGELLPDGTVWLFDIAVLEAEWATITPSDPFARRAEVLAELYQRWSPQAALFRLAPTTTEHDEKIAMAMSCLQTQAEGVIARRLTGRYLLGAKSADVLRMKFIHDADLVVSAVGFEGRDNVVLVAYDADGVEVEVGRASAHGKGVFKRGDVVTVRYNYMSGDGRLVGPRIMCKRTDKAASECTTDQLVYSKEVPVHDH